MIERFISMSIFIADPWEGQGGYYVSNIDVSEMPTHSRLLDKYGNPMQYETRAIGFDLKPKNSKMS